MKIGNFKEICEGKSFRFTFPHREDHIYFVREAWVESYVDDFNDLYEHYICRFKKETDTGLHSLPVEFWARLIIPNNYPKSHIKVELEKNGKIIASNNASKMDIASINSWFGFVNDMVIHATQILEPLPF
jgi:hypothetical protein